MEKGNSAVILETKDVSLQRAEESRRDMNCRILSC